MELWVTAGSAVGQPMHLNLVDGQQRAPAKAVFAPLHIIMYELQGLLPVALICAVPHRSLPGGVGVPERLERALRHHSRRGLPAGGRGQDPGRQQLGPQVWLGPAFAPVRLTVMTGVPVDAMCA